MSAESPHTLVWDTHNSLVGALPEAARIGIKVQPARGMQCLAPTKTGWICTRRLDHGGRHLAALSDGTVVAVWRQA